MLINGHKPLFIIKSYRNLIQNLIQTINFFIFQKCDTNLFITTGNETFDRMLMKNNSYNKYTHTPAECTQNWAFG